MTRQEAFNLAVAGLAAQGFARSLRGYNCMYRGENGMRCAIGHLIPDSEYDADMEGGGISVKDGKVYLNGIPCPTLDGLDEDFMDSLQDSHDNANNSVQMRRRLKMMRYDYGLIAPVQL